LKGRPFEPAPETVVAGGEFNYGRFGAPFGRANMLDNERLYAYRVPRAVRNWRLKEWQAYQFGDSRWFFLAVLYNAKTLSLAQFIAYDRERKARYGFKRVLPGGLFRFPETLTGSNVYYRGSRSYLESACDYEGGSMQVTVVHGSRSPGRRFSGRFRFSCAPRSAAPNVVCLPFGLNRAMYSTKILMPMEGEFAAAGESFSLEGPSSMGIIDDHKGFYPYRTRYDWVTGFGSDSRGRRVGFNLTDNQARDPSRYNENCLWINGRIWPLPPIKVTRPQGDSGEWIVQDTEGMVDLVFVPQVPNGDRFNFGFIENDYAGPIGSFRGILRNGEGEKIQAERLYGMGERQFLRL
jgi:hypothetical protein